MTFGLLSTVMLQPFRLGFFWGGGSCVFAVHPVCLFCCLWMMPVTHTHKGPAGEVVVIDRNEACWVSVPAEPD